MNSVSEKIIPNFPVQSTDILELGVKPGKEVGQIIKKLENGLNLNFDESKSTFEAMMSGKVSEKHIYDILIASSIKVETWE